jgi:hypothetical protein
MFAVIQPRTSRLASSPKPASKPARYTSEIRMRIVPKIEEDVAPPSSDAFVGLDRLDREELDE